MNWTAFFDMGGYALYVWPAYAAAALVLLLNVLAPWRRDKAVRRALQEFYRTRRDIE
jgi:heme exporter protein D